LRKKIARTLALYTLPYIGALLIRILYLLNQKKYYAPETIEERPTIFACWHGELLMIPYGYLPFRTKPNVKLVISEHFDGNLIAKTLGTFGFETIRGSSTRGGAKALIEGIKALKGGYDLGITPDGPKGPRHHVADGIVAMAHKAGVKVVLIEIKPSKYWQVNSWDKFVIPKPFGTINYYISEPIDLSSLDLDEAKELIRKGLLEHEL